MTPPRAAEPGTAAVVGTGVIGVGWTALFLSRGLHVRAYDPAPGAQERLHADLAALGPFPGHTGPLPTGNLTWAASAGDAAAGAGFVQENGPEREDLKHALFAELDEAAAPGVVLASSSSGLLPTTVARGAARHPERVLVGHPFHPPQVIPLVEVVPGERTSEEAVEAALAFYTALGKRPVRLRAEVPGHLANRLQAALWQEAYSLVERGVATVADVDAAISHGPGLRWAVLGPFANQHLSGGPGGLAHVLAHLGPPTERWWRDLGEVTLTPALVDTLVDGVHDELGDLDGPALAARRDAVLAELLAAKSRTELP
ncbi:3-hydroxyacyl-CoA dehydrogenase NAD-binding domain-containing protein [Pseudonocardia spirodelae]|uniref:3-hydroxyacyl-CoA dehydrogenase NAD-binding domain-containing protein n=1 Tax=Pseudonocardia spirodelae TaxID=3133431 RepID=A0ABU8TBD7_9PSEU